jgi:hypothetical protein
VLRRDDKRVTVGAVKTLVALVGLLLMSCAAVPGNPRTQLAGEWVYKDPVQSCRYVFSKDGTFSGEVTQRGEALSRFTGKWAVQDGALLYEYTSDALGRIPPGTRDRDTLLEMKKTHFVIEASDGSRRTYRRIL